MSIFTRRGDRGTSSTLTGLTEAKDSPVFEAVGSLDELMAHMGTIRAILTCDGPQEQCDLFARIQKDLVQVGAVVSSNDVTYMSRMTVTLSDLEHAILALLGNDEIQEFEIPGTTRLDAGCHLARAVCRRFERRLVALGHPVEFRELLAWTNRLSDYLFALAYRAARSGFSS